MWITCHRMGRPPISASGFGTAGACSWSLVPRPPQRMITIGLMGGLSVGSASMGALANPDIFKAYDIRGLYGDELDAEIAELIGRAFVHVIAEQEGKAPGELRLGLGHDMRPSAPELAAAYREGMRSEGATVLDAGMVATEMLYYLVGSRDLDGGVMCTASHNPKRYTGAKLVRHGALALSGEGGIGEIRDMIAGGELEDSSTDPAGSGTDTDSGAAGPGSSEQVE